jgi:hypothetical protein
MSIINNKQFSLEDINNIYENKNNIKKIISIINSKVNYKVYSSPVIDNYKEIICFSDIHADLVGLIICLLHSKIMVFIDDNGEYISTIDITENYETIDIFRDYLCKYKIKFIKEDTLIIFLGDLIDGRRKIKDSLGTRYIDIINKNGLNELGIHILLYNLSASILDISNLDESKRNRSKINILYGNHELYGLIDTNMKNGFYDNYMDYSSQIFYSDESKLYTPDIECLKNRNLLLMPFYLMHNQFINMIITKDFEITHLFSHADLNPIAGGNKYININFENLSRISNKFSKLVYESFVKNIIIEFEDNIMEIGYDLDNYNNDISYASFINNIIESRKVAEKFYTKRADVDSCDSLLDITFIVGHTSTSNIYPEDRSTSCLSKGYSDTDKFENSYERECIYAFCKSDKSNKPKLIFVDNAFAPQLSFENYILKNYKEEPIHNIWNVIKYNTFTEHLRIETNQIELNQIDSVQFDSVQFDSVQFDSFHSDSLQFKYYIDRIYIDNNIQSETYLITYDNDYLYKRIKIN